MTTANNAPSVPPARRPLSKGLSITVWALQGLAAAAFLAAGGSKLASAPAMVEMFAKIGAGQWLRFLTGGLEVIGAVALAPRAAFYGAVLLAAIMAGAIVTHLAVLGGSPIPALVLLVIVETVARLRRPTAY